MQKYQDVILKPDGTVIQGASVLVQSYPGAITSTIYSDDGVTTQTNPMTTDSLGRFSFYAANGQYQLVVSGASIETQTVTDILLDDPPAYDATTFTPAIAGDVTPGTVSYSSRFGTYTKVGDLVTVTIGIVFTTYTGAGSITVSGLPFTSSSTANSDVFFSPQLFGFGLSDTARVTAHVEPNTTVVRLGQVSSGLNDELTSVGVFNAVYLNFSYTV